MRKALKYESAALVIFYNHLKEQLEKGVTLYEHECNDILDKIRKNVVKGE